ncbi:MAG TPA: multicopper oxidase domain-containing protein [Candidatus Baltobacteraceae bacterium]|nr:multicopper oxidase domain-containing protein [Candidatus Baltobacteraceae bacterium]
MPDFKVSYVGGMERINAKFGASLRRGAVGIGMLACLVAPGRATAAPATPGGCPVRPSAGSVVQEPEDLSSRNGVLRVDLTYRNFVDAAGQLRFCYVYKDGTEAPTLRLKPGDLLVLRLKNEEHAAVSATAAGATPAMPLMKGGCTGSAMTAASTNLHFHGLTVPPVCHEDDVLNTFVQPGDRPFEYRFRIPRNETPGLYWYHPHVHGLTSVQVQGGASGALIIEGIERANKLLAGLTERVMVIRDQPLANPNAAPVTTSSMPPPLILRDNEGDILNTNSGGGTPARDLSINFVPVPYPAYPPGVVKMRPGEKQLWCVLNASAITYLDLQLLIDNKPQMVGVVSLDGAPIDENGTDGPQVIWESHALIPPAGRVGIIVRGPSQGSTGSFVTRPVDTGPAGENDPTRPLATILPDASAPEPPIRLAAAPVPLPRPSRAWLGDVKPVRTRLLYFSEQPHDPHDPKSPTDFMITVDGQKPKVFDPSDMTPNIVAQQGDVEDWIVENRTQELHAFHIHQLHFLLEEWNGVPVDEPFLRDTINVAYWDGRSKQYPSVKLRMDFRDPNLIGTFVYHCHLLEHEDGGMMGIIQVVPKGRGNLLGAQVRAGRPLCGLAARETRKARSSEISYAAKSVKTNIHERADRAASF